MKMKHWQDAGNGLLGAWLIASPWVIGFGDQWVPAGNAVLVGAALIAVAAGAMVAPRAWEEWTEMILGVWLAASPWALGYATQQAASSSAFLTGAVVIGLALWVLIADKDFGWLGDGRAT